jgi:hypothetical protein
LFLESARLVEVFGLPLLAYLCATSDDEMERRLAGQSALTEPQENVLARLFELGEQAEVQSAAGGAPPALQLTGLGMYDAETGTTYGNNLRLYAGGAVEVPVPEDALLRALSELIRDVYPALLLPSEMPFPRTFGAGASLYMHPARESFESAVMADSSLAKLFPSSDASSGRHGMVMASTGRGGGIQLSLFAGAIIEAAWAELESAGIRPTAETLCREMAPWISTARSIADGEEVQIPALVGFAGVLLPPNVQLDLPWGTLRPRTASDEAFAPAPLAGKLSTTTEEGETILIDYSGDVVFETKVPYRVRILAGGFKLDQGLKQLSRDTTLDHRLEAITLGLLLAIDRTRPVVAVSTWQSMIEPLLSGRTVGWRDPRSTPGLAPVRLTEGQAASWAEWIRLIDLRRHKSIAVAFRRAISAACGRPEPSDALVDAVIVWENLFGSKTDTALRISAGAAWLLERDPQRRDERQAEISKLYRLRSDIVHGSKLVDPSVAAPASSRALEIALSALRILIRDRPDLISDPDLGVGRSRRLLLDLPPAAQPDKDE